MNRKKLLGALAALALLALLAGCGGGAADDPGSPSAEPVVVRIGVVDEAQDYWPLLVEKAKAEGIDVQLTNFAGYTEENPALAQNQIDLNLFQQARRSGRSRRGKRRRALSTPSAGSGQAPKSQVIPASTEGGTRTHKPFRTADFESAASASPPLRPEVART